MGKHGIPESRCHVLTFHSFSFKLLKLNYSLAGFLQPLQLVSLAERTTLLKECICKLGFRKSYSFLGDKNDNKQLQETLKLISDAKRSKDPEEHLRIYHSSELVQLFKLYKEKMRERCLIDFEDMVPLALEMLRNHPHVLSYYQSLYRFCLCDEFQDTNPCQRELLLLLGAHGRVTAVGDPNQLIYRFQGADVANFEHFKTHFSPHQAVNVKTLKTNYRSTGPIIHLCNAILRSNPDDASPLTMMPAEGMEDGCHVEIVECMGSPDCQFQFVATMISELIRTQRDLSASEIAILCRDNKTVQRVKKYILENEEGIRISTSDEGTVAYCYFI